MAQSRLKVPPAPLNSVNVGETLYVLSRGWYNRPACASFLNKSHLTGFRSHVQRLEPAYATLGGSL